MAEVETSGHSATHSAYSDTAPTNTEPTLSPTSAQSEPYTVGDGYGRDWQKAETTPPSGGMSSATLAARVIGLIAIIAIAAVVVFEVLAWYKFYDHPRATVPSWGPGWTTWLRHPLSPFKAELDALEASGDRDQMEAVKRQLNYAYMLLGDGEGNESSYELMTWAAAAWSHYILKAVRDPRKRALLTVERGPDWVQQVEQVFQAGGIQTDKVLLAVIEARPYVQKLKDETGPGADGLDWWLALGGANLALTCGVLALGAERVQAWTIHALGCSAGATLCYTLGSLYACWLIQAAMDVFGTEFFMLCPRLYCLLFFLAGLVFTIEAL